MTLDNRLALRDTTRVAIEPPTFSPPPEMRSGYLEQRKSELDAMLFQAGEGDWKPVMVIVRHVRGSGAMYGFEEIGNAAEIVRLAVQAGDANSLELLRRYADAVNNASV